MGAPPATPAELVLETSGDSRTLQPSRRYRVGRNPDSDIVLHDARVAWDQAVFRVDHGQWLLEDHGGGAGIYGIYVDGHRTQRTVVGPGSSIRFGGENGPLASLRRCMPGASGEAPTAVHHEGAEAVVPLHRRILRIGRGPGNDVVVDDLLVSHRHAELRPTESGYDVVDLHSHNGTFLNGRPVRRAGVLEGDLVGVGHSVFRLVGTELAEFTDTGDVSLDAADLVVRGNDGTVLLDDVTFPVPERSLLAVVGPSGAGKSTLLNALTGLRPADEGSVFYDSRDLYRDYAELRLRIGVVPQEDILHQQLRVRRALDYAAQLRFPGDTARAERQERVDEVLASLGMLTRAQQPIHRLSGGQRKRVSVALELLTKPSLLFLDEPTSGLDPGRDRSMMRLLESLAHEGRSVIVVTHSMLNLDVCDRLLVLAPGGRIAYYGPPGRALEFLGFERWPDAFVAFEEDRERDWAGDFRSSPLHREFVSGVDDRPRTVEREPEDAARRVRRSGWVNQALTLIRRYTATLASDRTFLLVMLALPMVMGLMARALAGTTLGENNTLNTLLILCVGAVLTGAANAVRELVKERPIYQRERAVGLPRSAYLFSKVAVLGLITVIQAIVLTVVAVAGADLSATPTAGVIFPPLLEIMIATAVLAFSSMMLGLLVSAVVSREEVTMPLLVLIAVVQVVFCGALLPLNGVVGLEQLSWLVPARWALGAMGSTIGLQQLLGEKYATDPVYASTAARWLFDMGVLIALTVVLGGIVQWLLRRQEPAVMRR